MEGEIEEGEKGEVEVKKEEENEEEEIVGGKNLQGQ